MKAVVSAKYGLDALELRELDTPVLEDHQLLIRVHASSVNPADWYRVTGPFFSRAFGGGLRRPKSPAVGGDVAGIVSVRRFVLDPIGALSYSRDWTPAGSAGSRLREMTFTSSAHIS